MKKMILLLKENSNLRTRVVTCIGAWRLCLDSAGALQLCTVVKAKVSCLQVPWRFLDVDDSSSLGITFY